MEYVDICKQYFLAFQEKNIKKIGEMVHESIELKDWEIIVNGKNNFLDANKKIFDDVTDISIIIKNQGIQDGSSFESIIVGIGSSKFTTISGDVPHVTCGWIELAFIFISLSYIAFLSEGNSFQ